MLILSIVIEIRKNNTQLSGDLKKERKTERTKERKTNNREYEEHEGQKQDKVIINDDF